MDWAEEEFETLELGDARLNRRAVLLAERLSRAGLPRPANARAGAAELRSTARHAAPHL